MEEKISWTDILKETKKRKAMPERGASNYVASNLGLLPEVNKAEGP